MVCFGSVARNEQGVHPQTPPAPAASFVRAAKAGFRENVYSAEISALLGTSNSEFVAAVRAAGASLAPEVLGSAIPQIAQIGTLLMGSERTVFALRLMIGSCSDSTPLIPDGRGFQGTLQQIAERHILKHAANQSYDFFGSVSVEPIPPNFKIEASAIPGWNSASRVSSIH